MEDVRDEAEHFDEDKYLKKIPISLQYLKKMLWKKVIFCLQVIIEAFYKLILSLWVWSGMHRLPKITTF